jgi:hypothetical protein
MTKILEGKKTYIGAAAVIGGAVCKVVVDWYYGNPIDVPGFIATFGVGLGILGIGVKIHK